MMIDMKSPIHILALSQLLILIVSFQSGVRATALRMPIPTIDIKWREDWDAREPKAIEPLKESPAPYVVVHHSATKSCFTEDKCKTLVKSYQTYHMDTKKWDDIGYNFVIGEDGNIYEGRGWGIKGVHAVGYNSKSVGIAITGTFTDHLPNDKAMKLLQDLIEYGVMTNKIAPDYKLIGHRQAQATECPGKTLYDELIKWDHWSPVQRK